MKEGDIAYPTHEEPEGGIYTVDAGLTKREYFAAMAMQGILSNPKVLENPIWADGDRAMDELTAACIEHADHLLKQLEK